MVAESFGPSSAPMPSSPISWPPSEYWDGADGNWSSFALRVGNPEQILRVLPSTAGQATWAVIPPGCPLNELGTSGSMTCAQSRGGLFNISQSTSWHYLGNNSLGLERNLGGNGLSATYGIDTIALGFTNAIGGPTLDSQVVAGLETPFYYMGLFGLGNQPTNLTNLTDPLPSFLSVMKTAKLIPSLSWAYTAGAKYKSKGFLASLTFGGYDSSRIIPNNVPFFLAPDISRDLVVGLQSITSTRADGSAVSLLSSKILTFIDSTLPYIIVSQETCLAFENVFGLMWNTSLDLYVVNDTLHHNLITHNPSFTFRIADSTNRGPTVDIVMPYASFDLSIDHPLLPDNTNYFPLKCAQNSSQYTLGRTFLQEAYLVTNYEYSNFSVSQTRFEEGLRENIIAIPPSTSATPTKVHGTPSTSATPTNVHGPPSTSATPTNVHGPPSTSATPTTVHGHISHVAVIGTSLSATVFFLVSVFGIAFAIRRWRHKKSKIGNRDATELSEESPNPEALIVPPIQEIDTNNLCGPREVPDTGIVELRGGRSMLELEESPKPIRYELIANQDSAEHIMAQDLNARNRFAIFTSTGLLRESRPTVGTSTDKPNVEVVNSASPPRGLQDLNRSLPPTPISESPQVWPFETIISTSHPRGDQDLDRSLPPTPVPESPQVWPFGAGFNRHADKK